MIAIADDPKKGNNNEDDDDSMYSNIVLDGTGQLYEPTREGTTVNFALDGDDANKKKKKKKRGPELPDLRPDWDHPTPQEIRETYKGQNPYKKKNPSWNHAAYRASGKRLHMEWPGQVEIKQYQSKSATSK